MDVDSSNIIPSSESDPPPPMAYSLLLPYNKNEDKTVDTCIPETEETNDSATSFYADELTGCKTEASTSTGNENGFTQADGRCVCLLKVAYSFFTDFQNLSEEAHENFTFPGKHISVNSNTQEW